MPSSLTNPVASTGVDAGRAHRSMAPMAVVLLATLLVATESKAGRKIVALARLAPANGLVNVGVTPGARIDRLEVGVGSEIEAGDLVAVIQGHAPKTAQLLLAKAKRDEALFERSMRREELSLERKRFDEEQAIRRQTVTDSLSLAEESLAIAQESLSKLREARNVIAINQQRLAIQEIEGQLVDARTRQKELDLADSLVARKRELEDRRLSDENPMFAVLERQVEMAAADVETTRVYAPSSGTVLETMIEPGEISRGPILILGDTSRMVAVAEVHETDAPAIEIGADATLRIFEEKVNGKVERVSSLVSANRLVSVDPLRPRGNRVIEVRIELDESKLAGRYVNLEVEVEITSSR